MTNEFQKSAKKLESISNVTDAVVAETRLHFDTLVQVHAEELQQSEERHAKEKEQMRKHYGKIIAALSAIVCLCVATAGVILLEFAI